MRSFILTSVLAGTFAMAANAQDFKMPAPSPTANVKQDFSTSSIEISYSRPAMRGRKIFGDLVPFGKVWRTGANSATKLTFGEDVTIGGQPVAAGSYALYTIPGEKEWKIILNKGTGNWGTDGFDYKDDVATFTVPSHQLPITIQSFSISINNITINSCDIDLLWENTAIVIPVKADNDKRITDYLESQMNTDKPPYQQAANYYLETGNHLDKAAEYAGKAIDANPKAFYLYWLKARILQKLGKKTEALEAAKKAADAAASSAFANEYKMDYERMKKELE